MVTVEAALHLGLTYWHGKASINVYGWDWDVNLRKRCVWTEYAIGVGRSRLG